MIVLLYVVLKEVGAAFLGVAEGFFVEPFVNLRLIARYEYIRNTPTLVLGRAGVNAGLQESVLETVAKSTGFVAEGSGKEADNGVRHNGSGHLSAREDKVTNRIFLGNEVVTDTLVHAFVVPAEYDDVLFERESVCLALGETFPIGGGEDNLIVVTLCGEVGDGTVDGFDLQDHARAETKGVVVHLAVLVKGEVAEVVHIYFGKALVLGTLHYGVVER